MRYCMHWTRCTRPGTGRSCDSRVIVMQSISCVQSDNLEFLRGQQCDRALLVAPDMGHNARVAVDIA